MRSGNYIILTVIDYYEMLVLLNSITVCFKLFGRLKKAILVYDVIITKIANGKVFRNRTNKLKEVRHLLAILTNCDSFLVFIRVFFFFFHCKIGFL